MGCWPRIAMFSSWALAQYRILKGFSARLVVDPNDMPKFYKSKDVRYALREGIRFDSDKLERPGILEQVSTSDWASAIVPVPTSQGSVRICGYMKMTINSVLEVDQYPYYNLKTCLV